MYVFKCLCACIYCILLPYGVIKDVCVYLSCLICDSEAMTNFFNLVVTCSHVQPATFGVNRAECTRQVGPPIVHPSVHYSGPSGAAAEFSDSAANSSLDNCHSVKRRSGVRRRIDVR